MFCEPSTARNKCPCLAHALGVCSPCLAWRLLWERTLWADLSGTLALQIKAPALRDGREREPASQAINRRTRAPALPAALCPLVLKVLVSVFPAGQMLEPRSCFHVPCPGEGGHPAPWECCILTLARLCSPASHSPERGLTAGDDQGTRLQAQQVSHFPSSPSVPHPSKRDPPRGKFSWKKGECRLAAWMSLSARAVSWDLGHDSLP